MYEKTPTPRENRRSRNRGRAITGKQPGTFEQRVDARNSVVQEVEVPWHQRYMTKEEAAAIGLANLPDLISRMGFARTIAGRWRYMPGFPEPKAMIHECNASGALYSAAEFLEWAKWAYSKGLIRKPLTRKKE